MIKRGPGIVCQALFSLVYVASMVMLKLAEAVSDGFLCCNHLVAPGIELRLFHLQLGVGKDIGHAAAYAFIKTGGAQETGDGTLQLRAVEDDGDGLVAQQIAREIPFLGGYGGQEVGGDMIGFESNAQRIGDALVDLVPRQLLVAHNLEDLADSLRIAQETYKTAGEVLVPCECP